MHALAKSFKSQGYLRLEGMFSSSEIQELQNECKTLFDKAPKRPYSEASNYENTPNPPALQSRDHEVLKFLLGRSHKLDTLIEKVVTSKTFADAVHPLIGERYTMWTADLRRSTPNDIGLGLHQDADGELGITILLDDNDEWSSATVFIPGSQWIPVRLRETALNYMNTSWVKWLLRPVQGKAGDVYLFFHSTWHGRFPNTSGRVRSILLISVFPEGYPVEPQPMTTEAFNSLPPRLKVLMTSPSKEIQQGAVNYHRVIDQFTYPKEGFSRAMWKLLLSLPARLRPVWLAMRGISSTQPAAK
jgi:putative 2OG-Fe(II) oxygenase